MLHVNYVLYEFVVLLLLAYMRDFALNTALCVAMF